MTVRAPRRAAPAGTGRTARRATWPVMAAGGRAGGRDAEGRLRAVQTVWLEPDAVRRVPSGLPAVPVPGWDELDLQSYAVPPVEPDGSWSRRWEAAVPVALAHLVVACGGRPAVLPGPLTELVGDGIAGHLPAGPPVLTTRLAGPGTPVPRSGADILVVPRHPVTGQPWRPPHADAPPVVPLDSGVWAHPQAFGGTLARLPGIRRPELSASCDRYADTPSACCPQRFTGPRRPAGWGRCARTASSPPGNGTWRPPPA